MVSQRTNPNPNGVAEDLRCQILHIEDSADIAIRRKRLADDSSSAQWKPRPDSATGFRSDITADTDLSSAGPSGLPSGAMDTQAQMMKVK